MGDNRESVASWRVMLPNLTVFLSSSAIMVLELVAGRIISRYLGMSLYTWTAIIGLILAGMSVGNYVGGWIADRYNPARALGPMFFLSALAACIVLPLNTFAGEWAALSGFSWPTRIFVHVGLVFFVPAMALGAITPLVAKIALGHGTGTGRAVGNVFAWGAAGSILGTFFAGYYLVLAFGVREIVIMMAAVLALLGLIYTAAGFRTSKQTPPEAKSSVDSWAPFVRQLGPNATVFVSNAGFMTLEMVASRIVSRQFGASLYTWTTVIGVVLAGVTIGNFIGGRLADRYPSRRVLAYQFLLGSALMIASGVVSMVLLRYWDYSYSLLVLTWPTQIFIFVSAAYFLPCLALGTVSPMVVRLTLTDDRSGGRVVGAIYAWGTIGSIAGTFAAGYFLIDRLGTVPLIGLTALALAITSLVYLPKNRLVQCGALACLIGAVGLFFLPTDRPGAIYVDETNYSYVAITADKDRPHLRKMWLDKLIHSEVNTDDPTHLIYEYEWVYESLLDRYYPAPHPMRAMLIGGGGFIFPHYLESTRPGSVLEVSEIDPAVTEAAHAAFGFPRDTTVEIYDMDARNRVMDVVRALALDPELPKFDCVIGDSFSDFSVPYHLTTLEFVKAVRSLLTDDGLYLLNMVDRFNSGHFLAAEIKTIRQVFEYVYAFNVSGNDDTRATFVLVCANRSLRVSDIPDMLRKKYGFSGSVYDDHELDELIRRTDSGILTDNYAPVENFLAPLARLRFGEEWEIHFMLGVKHMQGDRASEAQPHFEAVLEVQPTHLDALYNLGLAHAAQGQLEPAAGAWKRALEVDPTHGASAYNLVFAYTIMRRFDEAWDTVHASRAQGVALDVQLIANLQVESGRSE